MCIVAMIIRLFGEQRNSATSQQPSSCFYKNANVRRKDRFIFLACLLTFFLSPYSSRPVLPWAESRCSLQNLIRMLGGCLHKSFSTLLMSMMNKTQLYFCHFSYLFIFICPVICVFICSAVTLFITILFN